MSANKSFTVDSVQPATTKEKQVPFENVTSKLLSKFYNQKVASVEIASSSQTLIPTRTFMETVLLAFANHYPLSLKPDDLWTVIMCGFAKHVELNSAKLRSKFVAHDGKKKLVVLVDHFRRGEMSVEDWQKDVFPQFATQIETHVGPKLNQVVTAPFSTTSPLEQACFQTILMAVTGPYFSYEMRTRCGIPEIQLQGTVDDWEKLKDRFNGLCQYMLETFAEEWSEGLLPVLDQFIAAAAGSPDVDFWKLICKKIPTGRDSGDYPTINGWINAFYPYVGKHMSQNFELNDSMSGWATAEYGPDPDCFPRSITSVPVDWNYFGVILPMHFHSGLLGAAQDPVTKMISPQHGWVVSYDP